MDNHYDLIISGGSLVGLSLARALASLPIKIAVIEPRSLTQNSVQGGNADSRAIALSYGSRMLFDEWGVWEQLLSFVNPISNIHCSEKGRCGHTHLHAEKEALAALGYVIPFASLQAQLYASVREQKNLTFFSPAALHTLHTVLSSAKASGQKPLEGEAPLIHVQIKQADGALHSLNTSLLIAADGANSFIRQQLGMNVEHESYAQAAIIADVQPSLPHKNSAYERFSQEGPMALLPLKNGRCALVYTVPAEQLSRLLGISDAEFLTEIQQRFGFRLGHFCWVSARQGFPLSRIMAQTLMHSRTLLLGNAAHSLHPIAGQGFNLGLRDVATLSTCLMQAHERGLDFGNEWFCQRYEALRRADHQQTDYFTHGLLRLFEQNFSPAVWGRSMAMHAINFMPALKHCLTRRAAGLSQHSIIRQGLPS